MLNVLEHDAETMRARALEATRLQQWPTAASLWEELADSGQHRFEAPFRLSEALFFLGRHKEAISASSSATTLQPTDVRPLVVAARAQTSLGRAAEAAVAWRAVLVLMPDDFEAWARLAQSQMLLTEITAALHSLVRALSICPDHAFGIALAAKLLGCLGAEERVVRLEELLPICSFDAGLSMLQIAVQLEPQDMKAQALLAARLMARNAYAEAVAPLTALVKANPNKFEPLRNYARALHRAQQWKAAIKIWRRVLKLRPNDLEPGFRLAQALRMDGQGQEALRHYRRTLKRHPADPVMLRDYGRCLADLGRVEEADAAWGIALGHRRRDPVLRLEYAAYLLQLRRYSEALPLLEAQIHGDPGYDRASLLLLRLLQGRGDAEAVLRRFGPAIASGLPAMPDASAREVALRCGLLLCRRGRLGEAASLIEPAYAADPADRLGLRAVLYLLLSRNDEDAARALAKRTLETHRDASWAWREVILAFADSEQPEFALAAFEEAAALFHEQPSAWLDIAEAGERDHLGGAIREQLAHLVLRDPDDRLRASRLALREGMLELAGRLLGDAMPNEALAEEWQQHGALLARARILTGDRADAELVFPDVVFDLLCSRAAQRVPRTDWVDGPIVLANSALAGGGAERQIAMSLRGLAAYLGSAENLHLICTRMTESASRRFYLPAVQEAGVAVTDLAGTDAATVDLSALDQADRDLLQLLGDELQEATVKLYGAFMKLRPRVVHLWQDRTSIDGAIAAVLAGVPRIVLCARSTRPVTRQRLRTYMSSAYTALRPLPQVVFSNNSLAGARDYEAWLGLARDKVRVIHNGFEFDKIAKAADPTRAAAIRAELKIPEDAQVVGGVLRLSDVKQPLLWVKVAAQVAQARPDVHFVLAGDGPLRSNVLDLARSLDIMDRFHLPGHVEVPPWFRVMDVVLLTSRTEGLPNVLVEAQSLGRPVISTRVGGVPETLLEGITGWSVPPDHPGLAKALAEKVLASLNDRAWLERARSETVRFVIARFSTGAMIQRTLELYNMVEPQPEAAPEPSPPPLEPLPGEDERMQAQQAMQAEAWATAAAAWEALLLVLPEDPEALLGAGQAWFRQNRMAEARRLFAQALRCTPGEEALRWLARSLRALGEEREALAMWGQLLRALPRDLEAWLRSVEGKAKLGDLPNAIATADEARRQLGSNAQLVRLQARLQTEAGNLDEALRHWNALADAVPADAEAQFRAGQLAQRLGDEKLAERRLRAALAAPRPVVRAAAVLAKLLCWTGRMTEARAVLRQALRSAPTNLELWQAAFEWQRVAARHTVVERYFRALERSAGENPRALLRLAERLAEAECPARASAVLQPLLNQPAVAAAAAERLARLALRVAETEAAMAMLRVSGLPSAIRSEIVVAGRLTGSLRAESGESDPQLGFVTLVARGAQRRGHPRYLPRPGSVVHVVNSLALGGSERQCGAMARAQSTAGREVTVLRSDPGRAGRAVFFLDDLMTAGVASVTVADYAAEVPKVLAELPDLTVPPGLFGEALRPRQVGGLAAALRALRPESVVVWSPQCMADAALAALALGVPRVIMRSGSIALPMRDGVTETEAARYRLWRTTLRTLLLQGGGMLLNNCAANLEGWVEWLGLPTEAVARRCGVLPNIIDAANLQPGAPAAVAALRQSLGIPPGVPVVGSVMRLEQEKGVDLWLELVRALRAVRPDAVFLVAGDGRLADPLRQQLVAEGLLGNVRLAGRVGTELPLYYSLIDVLLLTSSVEGLPNAVLEAQCFGLPVVAPRVGGVSEALAPAGDDQAADHIMVDGREPGVWCSALITALASPDRRPQRLASGRRFIAGRFTAPAVLAQLDGFLAAAGSPL